jgi:hypothetical protein
VVALRAAAREADGLVPSGDSVVLSSPPAAHDIPEEHAAEAAAFVKSNVELSGATKRSKTSIPDLLAAIVRHPGATLIRAIEIGEDRVMPFREQAVIAALVEEPPPHLESLHMTSCTEDMDKFSWYVLGDCEPLFDLPLRTLVLQGSAFDLGHAHAPTLEQLELRTVALRKRDLAALFCSELPSLTTLKLFLGPPGTQTHRIPEEEHIAVKDLAPLFEGRVLPTVKHLGLQNTELADGLCAALVRSAILPRLSSLDLSRGTLSDRGAAILVANKDKLAHLEVLDLGLNFLSAQAAESLKGVAKRVVARASHRDFAQLYNPE